MGLVNEIWEDKSKRILNPVAFSEVAERYAQAIADEGKRNKNKNAQSQVRKFYDAIFRLNERAKAGGDFNAILVELNRELALVHYAKGKDKVTNKFVDMMKELITAVKNKDDLDVITRFLECFIAFYKIHGPTR